jgi:hypothetical protein
MVRTSSQGDFGRRLPSNADITASEEVYLLQLMAAAYQTKSAANTGVSA